MQGPNLNIDRVPESGRAFEGYGEDPVLVSAMGVADIEGIQSEGVMADAKHFTAYNQETYRIDLDEQVSPRALEEIYLPPFKAAVEQANVASIMCSYGSINGTPDCADPGLFHLLYAKWGFQGFVRSDLGSVANAPAAFAAGLDAIKPAASGALVTAIADGALQQSRLDDAVQRILTEMFDYHLIENPIVGHVGTRVDTKAHAAVALQTAEQSMVLLKNRGNVLPLNGTRPPSIAVIGLDGSTGAMTVGQGSAQVVAPFVSTPYNAIRSLVAHKAVVRFAPGGTSFTAPPMLTGWTTAVPRVAHGVGSSGASLASRLPGGQRSEGIIGTGSFGHRYSSVLRTSTAQIVAPTTGTYVFSLTDNGDAWLSVGGQSLIASPGVHGRSSWSASMKLLAGHHYKVSVSWYPLVHEAPPVVGWSDVQRQIAQAVAAAKSSKVAIVFVSAPSGENHDRPNLSLPGDENALIDAVAAVNRHTVVVLNTGGPVLMPWLAKVASVLEAWFPGEADGSATAAVLFGKVDPSGRLPVTFPATNSETPVHAEASWPGVDGVVTYSEGLDVGYRYDEAYGLTPLFPFGFGLSYTSFAMSDLDVASTPSGYTAQVTVTNTGARAGREVVQAYLQFPDAADEPPRQLKAFTSVELSPGESSTVNLALPDSSFESFQGTSWQVVPGSYGLFVGDSSSSLPLRAMLGAPTTPATAATPTTAAHAGLAP